MADTGSAPLLRKILLLMVFIFFLIAFISGFILNTSPNNDILNSKYGFNKSIIRINNTINTFSQNANTYKETLNKANPSAVDYIFLIFKEAFYIPLGFFKLGIDSIYVLTEIFVNSLGNTGIGSIFIFVLSIIISAIIVMLILRIIKTIRTGDSEY